MAQHSHTATSSVLVMVIVIQVLFADAIFKHAGSDEIGNYAGNILSTDWKLELKQVKNKLHIETKNVKSKRVFCNTFNQSTLKEMDFNVPIRKVIKMLQLGKENSDQKQYNISLTMGFCEAEAISEGKPDAVERTEFTSQFSKGNMMVLILTVDEMFFDGQFVFPLNEKEREETDILNDIISDLQEEIVELHEKMSELQKPNHRQIISFKSSKHTNPIQWDIVNMDTGNKLAIRKSSNQIVKILKKGTYRVSFRVGWEQDWGGSTDVLFEKNGTAIAKMKHYYSFNVVFVEILGFDVNDQLKIRFSTYPSYPWDATRNHFTFEYLGE